MVNHRLDVNTKNANKNILGVKHCRQTGKQRVADGITGNWQEFTGQGDAVALREARAAPDRSGERTSQ